VLRERAVAATASSEVYSAQELADARELAARIEARHLVFATQELALPHFTENPPDRCYYCKQELFSRMQQIARDEGLAWIAHAAQMDDAGDFRPGHRAAEESSARAPLMEAGLGKCEVRELARRRGLPNWDKPSMACLASRFPYGDSITPEKLTQVAQAERAVLEAGVTSVRARHHGSVARIEVPTDELPIVVEPATRERLTTALRALGFTYITLDLGGLRSGSMNEVL
jgi:pyridinium-3,5-biscarboxylic acid mononucleotide sulfurtransferase